MPICFIEAPAIRTETKTKLVEQTTVSLRGDRMRRARLEDRRKNLLTRLG